jgi:hypothetical protein
MELLKVTENSLEHPTKEWAHFSIPSSLTRTPSQSYLPYPTNWKGGHSQSGPTYRYGSRPSQGKSSRDTDSTEKAGLVVCLSSRLLAEA